MMMVMLMVMIVTLDYAEVWFEEWLQHIAIRMGEVSERHLTRISLQTLLSEMFEYKRSHRGPDHR